LNTQQTKEKTNENHHPTNIIAHVVYGNACPSYDPDHNHLEGCNVDGVVMALWVLGIITMFPLMTLIGLGVVMLITTKE
jgi:hypothetical protein